MNDLPLSLHNHNTILCADDSNISVIGQSQSCISQKPNMILRDSSRSAGVMTKKKAVKVSTT